MERRSIAAPKVTCPVCSFPLPLDAPRGLDHEEIVHLECRASPDSVNQWPEGLRVLLCLRCSRAFESDSKVRRTCKACRSKKAA